MDRLTKPIISWMHNGDLVPVVVIISVYHYHGVLALHDPWWVAFPVALAVDLTHYRTVKRAVKRNGWWWLAAVLTTALVGVLQWIFYAQTAVSWQSFVYASIVPLVIVLMAWLAESDVQEKITEWQGVIKRLQTQNNDLQADNKQLQSTIKRLQTRNNDLQSENKQLQAEHKQQQTAANELRAAVDQAHAQRDQLQKRIDQLQPIVEAWQALNNEHQTLARFLADQVTAEQAALMIGVKDVRTVKSRAEQLNGAHHAE